MAEIKADVKDQNLAELADETPKKELVANAALGFFNPDDFVEVDKIFEDHNLPADVKEASNEAQAEIISGTENQSAAAIQLNDER